MVRDRDVSPSPPVLPQALPNHSHQRARVEKHLPKESGHIHHRNDGKRKVKHGRSSGRTASVPIGPDAKIQRTRVCEWYEGEYVLGNRARKSSRPTCPASSWNVSWSVHGNSFMHWCAAEGLMRNQTISTQACSPSAASLDIPA